MIIIIDNIIKNYWQIKNILFKIKNNISTSKYVIFYNIIFKTINKYKSKLII